MFVPSSKSGPYIFGFFSSLPPMKQPPVMTTTFPSSKPPSSAPTLLLSPNQNPSNPGLALTAHFTTPNTGTFAKCANKKIQSFRFSFFFYFLPCSKSAVKTQPNPILNELSLASSPVNSATSEKTPHAPKINAFKPSATILPPNPQQTTPKIHLQQPQQPQPLRLHPTTPMKKFQSSNPKPFLSNAQFRSHACVCLHVAFTAITSLSLILKLISKLRIDVNLN
jgi:hypothetical protein